MDKKQLALLNKCGIALSAALIVLSTSYAAIVRHTDQRKFWATLGLSAINTALFAFHMKNRDHFK